MQAMCSESNNGHYQVRVRDICRLLGRTPSELVAISPPEVAESLGNWNGYLDAGTVRRVLDGLGITTEFRVLAFMNLKGGVGKTTSALAVGSRAAQLGFRTCIVDLDAQASATMALGGPSEDEDFPVFYDVWQNPEESLGGALIEITDGLYCLPSSLQNSMLDVALSNPAAQKGAIANLASVLQERGFDLVIIDCPPSLGAAVISTICGVDTIVIPASCDSFSMRGIKLTCQEARAIRETFGLGTPIVKILPTMLDKRKRLTGDLLTELKSEYGKAVLQPGIATSSVMSRELENRRTLYAAGVPRVDAHDRYDQLVNALLSLDLPCWREEIEE